MSVSILILTLNEEVNIEGCLQSVAWCDDVVVLDSFSTDRTVEIARRMGARVVQRKFDNYAGQRNYGLQDVQYNNPWVLMLDADERVPPELRNEIETTLRNCPDRLAVLSMRRRDHLFGRWLRRSSGYPTWFSRLVRVGQAWFERAVNEQCYTKGEQGQLQEHLDHYPFNKGLSAWLRRQDTYSSMEAELLGDASSGRPVRFAELFTNDAGARRRAQKTLFYRMPGRPLIMFFALYVVRGGFLDGRAGLTFSLLRSWYEFMLDCKRAELQRRQAGLPV